MGKPYFDVQPYDLGYLADFVELQELKTDLREVSGLGRNCAMFDTVRFWAYKAIRTHLSIGFDRWHAEVLEHAKTQMVRLYSHYPIQK